MAEAAERMGTRDVRTTAHRQPASETDAIKASARGEKQNEQKEEGDEPDPRHWWKTAVAASFPT
jgi:hypothetical protein